MQGNVNIPDSTITTNLSFRQLVLMNMQQLTNFPYIEKDFDALTDYELLSLVVKFLNDVIANQNEQNDSITRMYESFLELQTYVNNTKDTLEDAFNSLDDYVRNYFDNLDVQDEINNKLDQMLEDGVLEQIIEQFLQSTSIWCFDTVADMKAATNLINGSDARTLGYYSVNDGGGALYHITNSESLTDYQEELNSGLYANIIIENEMNVKQFGAKGDAETDDTDSINTALNYCNNVIIPSGTFMVKAHNGNIITEYPNLNGSIVLNDNNHLKIEGTIQCITNDFYYYQVINIIGDNVTIEGGNIYGDKLTHTGSAESEYGYCVDILSAKNITIKNCNIAYGWGDCIAISSFTSNDPDYNCKDVNIENCKLHDSRRQGISIIAANNITVNNCEIYNISGIAPQNGIDIESNYADDNPVKNVLINNCNIHDTTGASITTTAKAENVSITNSNIYKTFNVNGKNIVYDNCVIDNIANGSTDHTLLNNTIIKGEISVYNGGKVKLNNCKTYERFTSDNNSEEIIINNSELNYVNSPNQTAMFIVRATDSLYINNSYIKSDKALGTQYAKELVVENSIIENLTASVDGFFAKDFIVKNNFIKGYKMYRTVVVQNGTVPSYIKDNIYETKPDYAVGGTSSQYIFVTNNISPTALGTTGSLDHVVNVDNYNNSTT